MSFASSDSFSTPEEYFVGSGSSPVAALAGRVDCCGWVERLVVDPLGGDGVLLGSAAWLGKVGAVLWARAGRPGFPAFPCKRGAERGTWQSCGASSVLNMPLR